MECPYNAVLQHLAIFATLAKMTQLLRTCSCCIDPFDVHHRIPTILACCGHTICKSCTLVLEQDHNKCPFCDHPIDKSDKSDKSRAPITNYNLLKFITTVPPSSLTRIPQQPCLAHTMHTYNDITTIGLDKLSERNIRRTLRNLHKKSPAYVLKEYPIEIVVNTHSKHTILHELMRFKFHWKFAKSMMDLYNKDYVDHVPEYPYVTCAAQYCNLNMLKYLVIERGADINSKYASGRTAISSYTWFANFYSAKLKIVKFIVDYVKSIDIRNDDTNNTLFHKTINMKDDANRTPVMAHLRDKNYEVVKYLIDCGADITFTNDDESTILITAIDHGNLDIVERLIKHAPSSYIYTSNKNGITALISSAKSQNKLHITKYIINHSNTINPAKTREYLNMKDTNGETALANAIRTASTQNIDMMDTVQYLINSGSDLTTKNINDDTILITAVACVNSQTSLAIFKYVLSCYKNANIDVSEKTSKSNTALSNAIRLKPEFSYEVSACLIEAGANTDKILALACRRKSLRLVKYLVTKCGANVNDHDKKYGTPLLCAVLHNNTRTKVEESLKIIEYLVKQCGANVDARCADGFTALTHAVKFAKTKSSLSIVKYLIESCGANINVLDDENHDLLYHALQNMNTTSEEQVHTYLKTTMNTNSRAMPQNN